MERLSDRTSMNMNMVTKKKRKRTQCEVIKHEIETPDENDMKLNAYEINKFKNENEYMNKVKIKIENTDEYKIKYEDTLRNKIKEEKNEYMDDYCSDATYLARQMASEEQLSEANMKKLYNLRIQLRHKVPPQHQIETRAGSHMPSKQEIDKFEKIIPRKKGVYSHDEDIIIVHNWKAFCKLHDWKKTKPRPFLQLRVGSKINIRSISERRKFVQFLADGLPNRTLYSVYHRFKTLYENNVNTRYTRDEDEMILDHLENNPSLDEKRKYADLAKVLKRTRQSIWRRYEKLKKKKQIEDDLS